MLREIALADYGVLNGALTLLNSLYNLISVQCNKLFDHCLLSHFTVIAVWNHSNYTGL